MGLALQRRSAWPALWALPAHLIAYAIEGASFAPGAAMTPEFSAAADIVVARIAMELPRLEGDNA